MNEAEQLYYVRFIKNDSHSFLNSSDSDGLEISDNEETEYIKTKFTMPEILAIDPRYKAFAVPVEKVKADEGDPDPGFLMAKVAGRLMVDIDRHVLRLAGDTGVYPPNCYYGRNENGVWGFYPIPEQLLPPSGIGLDDDIYAELAEMSGDGFGRSEIF